jgi:hypothetical protein
MVAARRTQRTIARFFWAVSVVAAVVGGLVGYVTITTASGAPQQAAGAAMACLIVIAPYVLARGIEGVLRD